MSRQKQERMQELVTLLNCAAKAYYQDAQEIMSNLEYDRLYDELTKLEAELGITLSDSPTVNVGYEVLSELPKERHESPMLSLDKTKEVEDLKRFVGDQKAMMSWKMDGLTIVLTYRDGTLFKAVTRGNGEVGEVITNNARVFKNIPLKISYQGELILRGEAIIGYKDFEKINEEIADIDARYKNPRNLCSGSVRQLNNEITAKRNVRFYAFTLVQADGVDFHNSREKQMDWLREQGFECSMDDFGSGYSSLNMLKSLPVSTIKLDQKLFSEEEKERGKIVSRGIIQIARQLDMKVVAEGVETREYVDFLKEQKCDMIQGYYFGRPMPVDEFCKRM